MIQICLHSCFDCWTQTYLHSYLCQQAEDGVNPEDARLPPFLADMEGRTYTFQVRVTAFNFTEYHKTFTITRVAKDHGRLPVDVVTNVSSMSIMMFCYELDLHPHVFVTQNIAVQGDDDDDNGDADKPLPDDVGSGSGKRAASSAGGMGATGKAREKSDAGKSNVVKKARTG